MRAADGTGSDVRLTTSANVQFPGSVTPDGASVVGMEMRQQTGPDLVRFPLDGAATGRGAEAPAAEGLVETPFDEENLAFSPDGRFLAYDSNESGRAEVYVRPYPRVSDGRWQVSTGGGTAPLWTRGGRELVYTDGANRLTAVPVETTGPTFRAGAPATLFDTANVSDRVYDVTPDGQRFLLIKEGAGGNPQTPPPSFVVVLNWLEELKRLVPTQ